MSCSLFYPYRNPSQRVQEPIPNIGFGFGYTVKMPKLNPKIAFISSINVSPRVYVFQRNSSTAIWSVSQTLTPNVANSQYGKSMSVSDNGNILAVGGYAGNVHVYQYNAGTLQYDLKQVIANAETNFGGVVDVSPNGQRITILSTNASNQLVFRVYDNSVVGSATQIGVSVAITSQTFPGGTVLIRNAAVKMSNNNTELHIIAVQYTGTASYRRYTLLSGNYNNLAQTITFTSLGLDTTVQTSSSNNQIFIDGDLNMFRVVIGYPCDTSNRGKVLVLTRSSFFTGLSLVSSYTDACNSPPTGERFGMGVAVKSDGTTAYVCAPGRGSNKGGFYRLSWTGSTFTFGANQDITYESFYTTPTQQGWFGAITCTSDSQVLMGALNEQSTTGNSYFFDNNPAITTLPLSISHSIVQGQNQSSEAFNVLNSNGYTANVTITDDQSWLSVTPSSGTTGTVDSGGVLATTINYSTSSLPVGVHNATITTTLTNVTPNQVANVPVTMTVTPAPEITLTPNVFNKTMIVGNTLTNDNFTVTNTGGNTLQYFLTSDVSWLSVSPPNGTAPGNITLTYVNEELLAPGNYVGTITCTCTNFPFVTPKTLTVNLTVDTLPIINVNPNSFSHTILEGGSISNDLFAVTNVGGSTLQFSATPDVAWLSVSPTSGTAPQNVSVIYGGVNTLPVGVHNATITVSCTNFVGVSDETVNITITVNPVPPIINVSPNSFSHTILEGGTISNDLFAVTNVGGSTLQFSVTPDVAWLSVSPTSGTAPQNVSVIYGGVNTLPVGVHNATITVSCTNFVGVSDEIVNVTVTVNPIPPIIDVSPSFFSHTILEGGSISNDLFAVTNVGGSTLQFSATPDVAWLSVSPTSGTAPQNVSVIYGGVNALPVGVHNATITVSCTNFVGVSDAFVTVTITVNPVPPIINVTPNSFSHTIIQGNTLSNDLFAVTNVGGSTLQFSATPDVAWLSVSPTSGTAPQNVSVIYGGVNALPVGVHNATITVSCTNFVGVSDETVNITITVNPIPPIIDVSPSFFSHTILEGGTISNDLFAVTNVGGSTLQFSATPDVAWLSVSPTSGTAPQNVSVIYGGVNTLPVGVHNATITISCTNFVGVSDEIVNITITVNPVPPIISVSPNSFSHTIIQGNILSNDIFAVTNVGGSTLQFSATPDVAWLSVSPTSGTAPQNVSVIYGGVNALPVGVHNATITISCTNFVGVSDAFVIVTITVNPIPPIINVSPNSFSHTILEGGTISNNLFAVTNVGGSTLQFSATPDVAWLSVSPTSGTAPQNVTVIYGGVNSLPVGVHNATITISCTNFVGVSDAFVNITITVNPIPPIIDVSPSFFSHTILEGGSISNDLFAVTNVGGSTLQFSATPDVAWLSVSPTSGTAPQNVSVIYGGVNALPVGVHNATITVSCTNFVGVSDAFVTVTITVDPVPPIISVSPNSFIRNVQIGNNPTNDSFTISNIGGSTLQFSATPDVAWLSVSPTSGIAPQNVSVIYGGVNALPVGTHNATITISCTNFVGVSDAFVNISVIVSALPPPIITLNKNLIERSVVSGETLTLDNFEVNNTGGGTLDYDIIEGSSWLSVNPTSGTSTGTANIHTISYSTENLSVGSYEEDIQITCTNVIGVSDEFLKVKLNVLPKTEVQRSSNIFWIFLIIIILLPIFLFAFMR